MKNFNFLLLILLFSCCVYTQAKKDSILVNLSSKLETTSNKHEKIKLLLLLGDYQIEREFNRAEYYLYNAEKLIESCDVNHEKDLAFIYSKLGVINRRKGNYGEAITFYFKSRKMYEELKDTSNIAEVIHNTALLYRFQNNDKKAIEQYKKSLELSLKVKDTFTIAATYNMLGVSYRRIKLIDSALIYYKKAEKLFKHLNNEEEITGVSNNLATLYSVQKKYSKSLPIKLNNLEYYKKIGNKTSMSTAYYNISKDYSGLKKHDFALKYADSSLKIALKEGLKNRISTTYLRKSAIYRDIKDFENAYRNYRFFKKYSDSILQNNSSQKIKEFELKKAFELEKKELEIRSETQKNKNKLLILLFVNILILGILIAYLKIKNYRNKIKYVAQKLEKEELQKKLLDEKIRVSEIELKSLVADNHMRLTYLKQFYSQLKISESNKEDVNIKKQIKDLRLNLFKQIQTEEKLTNIQEKIDNLNKGFNELLIKRYPGLSKSEREVCSLLRLNLSIKELATIRNASLDSIKSIRYRIRKKLNIPKEIELESFIKSIK